MTSTLLTKASKALALGGAGLGAVATYRYQNLKRQESTLPGQELWKFSSNSSSRSDKNAKQVVVIGGGVVGVTAAYKLALKGHSVVLLEPRDEPGKECSACAAGGMQRSNPIVDRGTWVGVAKCLAPHPISRYILGPLLGGSHEPYKFFHIDWWASLSDPFFLRWVTTFTRTSLLPASDQTDKQKEMLAFTDYAVRDMIQMMENRRDPMAKKSGYNPRGSLSLSYDDHVPLQDPTRDATPDTKMTKTAAAPAAPKNPTGGKTYEPSKQVVGGDITALESSILHQEKQPTTAKYEYESCAASSERFTEELAERCATDPKLDVTFLYGTKVKAVAVDNTGGIGGKPRVAQLKTNRGVVDVPDGAEVVVAAGSWTPQVMALMDVYAPVYPLKGYAMSVSAEKALTTVGTNIKPQDLPSRIVSDKYMYTSRLGDEIRITSIGEFSGWSTKPSPDVLTEFRQEAIRQFPQLESLILEAKTKCGHRPYVSDGILLLGRVGAMENVLVSCGPGSNGWKLAMGSGDIVERLVSGQTEDDIGKDLGFDAHSFSPAGRVLNAPIFAKLCRARWNV